MSAIGRVVAVERRDESLAFEVETDAGGYEDLSPGESVAVDGACLTVVAARSGRFRFEAVVTTRGRTRFADLAEGDQVNLERALAVGDRLGGHFVQGHVDGIGIVRRVEVKDDALLLDVEVPGDVAEVSVLHGSIALDGVSLTVNAIPAPGTIQVALIPYTRAETTLGAWEVGDRVHVEGDMLGKFVRQLLRDQRIIASEGNGS